jgi:hypothetical protein
MSKSINPGDRFGRWIVLSVDPLFLCCDCGTERKGDRWRLLNGRSKSCGCYRSDVTRERFTTGNKKKHPLYNIWHSMHARCRYPRWQGYQYYGGRGIRVCDRWSGPDGFENFCLDMGPRPSKRYTLDRKKNELDYSPENCKWSTWKEQAKNRRPHFSVPAYEKLPAEGPKTITFDGQTKTIAEWADHLGITYPALFYRLKHWPLPDALTKPPTR